MSTISTSRSSSILDQFTRPPIDPNKTTSQFKHPLQAAQSATESGAAKAKSGSSTAVDASANADALAKARTAAEGLISTTFIEPILKQVRESNDTPPPFGPSSAEKQFSALLDTKLADEIVQAANFPLVERISQQLMKNMPQPTPATQPLDIQG